MMTYKDSRQEFVHRELEILAEKLPNLNMELGEIMNWPDWELVPFLSNNRGNNVEEVVKEASWV